jgi:membrane-associated protein
MDLVTLLADFVLHLDTHLGTMIAQYGLLAYAALFGTIFLETGLVITPFLPGDSLLFAAGAFAALGSLDLLTLFGVLSAAAILGDTANYWLGHYAGPKVFRRRTGRLFKEENLGRAQAFYERHGGKTIFLARFLPFVRTFAPFVAGMGSMRYHRFLAYNVLGGLTWVGAFLTGGFLFGNLPVVRDNFFLVMVGIIAVSFVPLFAALLRNGTKREGQS